MGNLTHNRRKEIGKNHPSSRKGKRHIGSSSQSRDDFETYYQRRDEDAMSDEQLQQLLEQHNGHFFQQQDIPTIDEEELEDEDAEEDDPTAKDEGDGTPHDDTHIDEPSSSQPGKKNSKSERMLNNFDKWKDPETKIWYATCKWCKKNISLGLSQGYRTAARHLKAKHAVEYVKLGKGKGKQTQISRFANSQPFGNFSYDDSKHLSGMSNLIVEENFPFIFSQVLL
ncbi:unnamed protein product [Cuscuta epithymum]|uniref:BED-type domain-containing protein n=1 Tax=Cuscuta epithymum TaxID=186058 RepID=A0AAV0ERA6_9ASTE|nr:unnamed protein product [Cuscuta epithymum]